MAVFMALASGISAQMLHVPVNAATGVGDEFVPLTASAAQLVPDTVHDRLWIRSSERGLIEVVDLESSLVRQVRLSSAYDLSLNAGGSAAYVSTDEGVVEIDAATLATRVFELSSACVRGIAAGAALVHFHNECFGAEGVLDPRTGEWHRAPTAGIPTAVPGQDRVIYQNSSTFTVLDATTSEILASKQLGFDSLGYWPPQVSSDGRYLLFSVTGDGDTVRIRDAATLASVAAVPSAEPDAHFDGQRHSGLAVTGDLLLSTRQSLVAAYRMADGELVNELLPYAPERWDVSGIATMGPDVLVAASSPAGSAGIFVERGTLTRSADLTLARPEPVDAFAPTTVGGMLTRDGVALSGETVTLTDANGELLASLTTTTAGRFSTELVFSQHGSIVARWAGGDAGPPAVAYRQVGPSSVDTSLTLEVPDHLTLPGDVPVAARLETVRGAAVPGREVHIDRRCDDSFGWERVGTAVTDGQGRAVVLDPPPPCLGVWYRAEHAATSYTNASSDMQMVTVGWISASISTSVTPDNPRVGDTVTAGARLVVDGEPAAGQTVSLTVRDSTHRLVTNANGEASMPIELPIEETLRLAWRFAGNDTTMSAQADTLVRATKLATRLTAVPEHSTVAADEAVRISGELTDERGEPVPGAVVAIPYRDETITDAAGRYSLLYQPDGYQDQTIARVQFAGDGTYLSTGAQAVFDVVPLPTSLTISATSDRVHVGEPVTLHGILQRARNMPASIEAFRMEPDGTRVNLPRAAVDANGQFTFVDQPPTAGAVRYGVAVPGDAFYERTEATIPVQVDEPEPVSLALSTDRTTYRAGATAQLNVTADRPTQGELTVLAVDGQGVRTLYKGSLAPTGQALEVRVTQTTQFIARVTSTTAHAAAETIAVRGVRLAMGSKVTRAWRHSDRTWWVDPSKDPRVVTTVLAARSGACLRYQVDRRVDGRWRRWSTSRCRRTDSTGRARLPYKGRAAGSRWRMRPTFAGDALNAEAVGRWVVIRFRRNR